MSLNPPEYFTTDQHCPICRKYGNWRSGQEFDHMKWCPDCEVVWIPESLYQYHRFKTKDGQPVTPESVARPPCRKPSIVEQKMLAELNREIDPKAVAAAIASCKGIKDWKPEADLPVMKLQVQNKPIIPPKPTRPPNIIIEERPFSTRIVKEINVIDIPHDAKLIKKPVLPDQDQGQPLLSNWWRKLRIMPDEYSGYEVRVKYIWWPFWIQLNFSNTHPTPEAAEARARKLISRETHYI